MIGIRSETKSKWESRAPLVPADVQDLCANSDLAVCVQSSPTRVFADDDYRRAGATVQEDLRACPLILGIKEIPVDALEAEKAYLFFSHTIKGQRHNMPMLQRLMDLRCTLIDYERIVDGDGRRLVFFGHYAGVAGMIDALWALGQRLEHEGLTNPLTHVRRAYEYEDVDHAKHELHDVASRIADGELPAEIVPLVCGFAGYGNVSAGAQQIFDILPANAVTPDELASIQPDSTTCYKVVFKEQDLVARKDGGGFDLQDYYDHPENYESRFFRFAEHLTLLMNCIYWTPRYPRLLTCAQIAELFAGRQPPKLRVVGDVSCDIKGSIECTIRTTEPDNPVYVYDPARGTATSGGVAGNGPVVLAVDILPCELPVDSSRFFSRSLKPFIPLLDRADLSGPLETSGLPPELTAATIVYHGQLTPAYCYLEQHLH